MKLSMGLILVLILFNSCVFAKDCSQLSTTECLNSNECTLELLPKDKSFTHLEGKWVRYQCRKDRNNCESGFKQGNWQSIEEAQKNCEAKIACVFSPANCFCPCRGYAETIIPDKEAPLCNCACGGGTPASCSQK